jgi:hypothetical protein
MKKNEILEMILEGLMKQRSELVSELTIMSHNDMNYLDRRCTLENAISNIDLQISNRVMEIDMSV